MDNVRCLIADMPQLLLADIVQNLADACSDIEVIGHVDTMDDITSVIAANPVDVLILGMDDAVLPALCVEMMRRVSNLAILGLVDDGRQLAVYLNDVGKNDILKILRSLPRANRA